MRKRYVEWLRRREIDRRLRAYEREKQALRESSAVYTLRFRDGTRLGVPARDYMQATAPLREPERSERAARSEWHRSMF